MRFSLTCDIASFSKILIKILLYDNWLVRLAGRQRWQDLSPGVKQLCKFIQPTVVKTGSSIAQNSEAVCSSTR